MDLPRRPDITLRDYTAGLVRNTPAAAASPQPAGPPKQPDDETGPALPEEQPDSPESPDETPEAAAQAAEPDEPDDPGESTEHDDSIKPAEPTEPDEPAAATHVATARRKARRKYIAPAVAVVSTLTVAVVLASCSGDNPVYRSARPEQVVASGVPYSGNGITKLDPQAILAAAVDATSSAPAVEMSGTLQDVPVPVDSIGTASASAPAGASAGPTKTPGNFTLDMVFTQVGAVGDITVGGAASQLLRIDDQVWAAEPDSFWAAVGASDSGDRFGGLYVQIPEDDPRFNGFADDTRIGYLLDALLQTSATWTKGPVQTVDGVSAVELEGSGAGGHSASVWVATDGQPYLIQIAPTGGSYQGRIDFTGYGERLAVQAPLPGQILDNALVVLSSASPSPADTYRPLATATSASPSPSASASKQPTPSASPSSSASPSASSSTGGSPSPSSSRNRPTGPPFP